MLLNTSERTRCHSSPPPPPQKNPNFYCHENVTARFFFSVFLKFYPCFSFCFFPLFSSPLRRDAVFIKNQYQNCKLTAGCDTNFRLLTDDSTNIVMTSHIYVLRKHNTHSSLALLMDGTVCNFHVTTKCLPWSTFLKRSDSSEVVTIRVT
jgi:hypothetical protein